MPRQTNLQPDIPFVKRTLPGNRVVLRGSPDDVRREMEKFFRFGWMIIPGSGQSFLNERLINYSHYRDEASVGIFQPPDYRVRMEKRKQKGANNEPAGSRNSGP